MTRASGAASVSVEGKPLTEGEGRVVRLHGARDLRIESAEIPRPKPGEVLLRVTAVGLCGSDRHWFEEGAIGDAQLAAPLVLGHEIAAVVESGPRIGERVAVDPAVPCDECDLCRSGRANLCLSVRFAGHSPTDGALRDWMCWPERRLHRIPDRCPDPGGALLEPLGVALHALDLAHIRPGDAAVVVGCGPIGLLLIQLARLSGAGWIGAVDPLRHRLDAARSFGASAVGPNAGDLLADANGRQAEVTFEVAGEPEAIESAVSVAAPGTRVVIVGIPTDDRIAFRASVARRKGLTILMARRMGHQYPRALDLVERGAIDVTGLVSHRFPLDEVGQAFGVLERREGIKVIVEPASARPEPENGR